MIQLSFLIFSIIIYFFPRLALAEWTPLIKSTDFDGIRADVLTTAAGIVSIVLVVIGLAWLVRSFIK